MPLDWSPFAEFVRRHRRFLLTSHVRPDGDALGSMLGMADILEQQGKEVLMTIASTIPSRYDFLDPARRVRRFEPPVEPYRACDAVIVLDTGTWGQLGDLGALIREMPAEKAVVDHHLTQDDLGATRFVDPAAEATGRLVYEASRALGVTLRPDAAHAVFVALAMDTGWFRHLNTTDETFRLAAELVKLGARPTPAYDAINEQNSLGRVLLHARVLSRMQLACGGRVSHMALHRDDYAATGATPQDSEDLVNYTRSIAGVEVGLFFAEQPHGGIKVSFRSRERVDVSKVAEQFGGGGHRLASGAVIESSLDEARARVLAAVESALLTLPESHP